MNKPSSPIADNLMADLVQFIRTTILAENVDFSPDTPLKEVGIDSVALLEILLYLERYHNIYIADEKLTPDNIASIRQLSQTALTALAQR